MEQAITLHPIFAVEALVFSADPAALTDFTCAMTNEFFVLAGSLSALPVAPTIALHPDGTALLAATLLLQANH
jgi:hypothetical protein